jgi:hypothetical protein
LENSIFEKTDFSSCTFGAVNFRESRAFQASFMDCNFDFPDGPRDDSAVNGMIVHSVEFTGCKSLKGEKVGPETFLDFGARIKESRYAGEFGRRFRKQMADFLGEGFKRAARIYIEEIGNALTPVAGAKEELYLIDIMAGDMSLLFQEEILLKFNKLSKLNLLAIDKDASTINQDVKFSEADGIRINIWEKEIDGPLGLKREFNSRFNVDHADLIIGKKALHEIKPEYQQQIFFELSECLNKDGRLVLYMDSPAFMSEKGFEKQKNFVGKIRMKTDNYELRRILMDELVFSGEADDGCVFTNIWVALKDYANENEHELQNRYFAGVNQITEWAKAAGLQVKGEIKIEKSNLMPKLFNENGFNKICSFIKDNPDLTISGNNRSIEETLLGTKRHQLLRDFTEKHLWNAITHSPTALGRTLSVRREPVQFRKIHPALADFSFFREEENQDINFSLPAHIATFAKAV